MTDLNSQPTNRKNSLLVFIFACLALVLLLTAYLIYARNNQNQNQLANQQSQSNLIESNTVKNPATNQVEQKDQEKDNNLITHTLTYENKGKIYLYNLETKQTEEITLIDQFTKQDISAPNFKTREPIWSPSGQYLAYLTVSGGAALYNSFDKTNKKLNAVYESPEIPYEIGWSPNSQFLLLELGSGGPSAVTVIDVVQDKEIGNHTVAFATSPIWRSDGKQFLITTPRDIGLEERSLQVQNGEYTTDLSLIQINESSTKATTVKSGNDLISYRAYGWTKDNQIRYVKQSYKSRTSSDYTSSYWIYNENGQDEEIPEDKDFSYGSFPKITNLPTDIKLYENSAKLSSDNQWVTFMSEYPSKIYLMKFNQPNTTATIAEGSNPSWQPF